MEMGKNSMVKVILLGLLLEELDFLMALLAIKANKWDFSLIL